MSCEVGKYPSCSPFVGVASQKYNRKHRGVHVEVILTRVLRCGKCVAEPYSQDTYFLELDTLVPGEQSDGIECRCKG